MPASADAHLRRIRPSLVVAAWKELIGAEARRIRDNTRRSRFLDRMGWRLQPEAVRSQFDWSFDICLSEHLAAARAKVAGTELAAKAPAIAARTAAIDEAVLSRVMDGADAPETVELPGRAELTLDESRRRFDELRARAPAGR